MDNEIEWKSKCGIKEWNEIYDEINDSNSIVHEASSESKGGNAKAHARAKDHGNGLVSANAGASAAGFQKGNLEALKAEAGAGAEFGPAGALGKMTNQNFSQ